MKQKKHNSQIKAGKESRADSLETLFLAKADY